MTLNFLIGNIDRAGGYITGGPPADYMGAYAGAPYNLAKWPGPTPTVPPGVKISREGSFYEETSLYQDAVKAGRDPYPTPRPWYPFGFGIWPEIFCGSLVPVPVSCKNSFPARGKPGIFRPTRHERLSG